MTRETLITKWERWNYRGGGRGKDTYGSVYLHSHLGTEKQGWSIRLREKEEMVGVNRKNEKKVTSLPPGDTSSKVTNTFPLIYNTESESFISEE